MTLRMYLLASLVLGMALALLSHFASVWIYGEFMIDEPNVLILTTETLSITGIMCFSLFCIFQQMGYARQRNK